MPSSFLNILTCISCNKDIQDQLYGSDLLPNLFTIIVGFIIFILIVMAFAYFSAKKFKKLSNLYPKSELLDPVPLSTAGVVMGIGLGGFF